MPYSFRAAATEAEKEAYLRLRNLHYGRSEDAALTEEDLIRVKTPGTSFFLVFDEEENVKGGARIVIQDMKAAVPFPTEVSLGINLRDIFREHGVDIGHLKVADFSGLHLDGEAVWSNIEVTLPFMRNLLKYVKSNGAELCITPPNDPVSRLLVPLLKKNHIACVNLGKFAAHYEKRTEMKTLLAFSDNPRLLECNQPQPPQHTP